MQFSVRTVLPAAHGQAFNVESISPEDTVFRKWNSAEPSRYSVVRLHPFKPQLGFFAASSYVLDVTQ
jgi:hypothetical protein